MSRSRLSAFLLSLSRSAGIAGKVKFVGFDGNDAILKGVEDKVIDAVCLQDPFNMGYLAVKHSVAHLKGEPVERIVDIAGRIRVQTEIVV